MLFPKQMHSERWVGALMVPGAVGSGMVWEKGSQGGVQDWGQGWHHSPKELSPLWQHRHQCLECRWGATGGAHKILLESLHWDFGGTSGFASPSLEGRVPRLVGHFTLSQAIQFLGPLPSPILLPYGEQLCFPAQQQLSPPTLLQL